MKNLARLTLFFSLCFSIFFLAAVLLRLLSSWVDFARFIPASVLPGKDAAALAREALPAVLYLSVLFGVSYSVQRNIPAALSILSVFVLACAFSAGVSLGIHQVETLKSAFNPDSPPVEGAPGLILSRSDTSMILLNGSSNAGGPRVVSIPGRPLIYQEVPRGPGNTILGLPPLPFGVEPPWFVRSLGIDFSLSAGALESRLSSGFLSLAVYVSALVLFLCSLRCFLELSRWPLANLFIGALVFRLVLSLETFLNAGEINALIGSFLNGRIAPDMITPLVFGALAAFFIVYTLLSRLARNSPPETKRPKRGRAGDD